MIKWARLLCDYGREQGRGGGKGECRGGRGGRERWQRELVKGGNAGEGMRRKRALRFCCMALSTITGHGGLAHMRW